jgi:hypothetical protein
MTQLERDVPGDYAPALMSLKGLVREAQQRAQRVANTAMIELYWNIGRTIIGKTHAEELLKRYRVGICSDDDRAPLI